MVETAGEVPEAPDEARVVFGRRLGTVRRYADLLVHEGLQRGLIGPREVERLWSRHLVNCAVIGELIPSRAWVVDIGSGAGLPGIVLSIHRPDVDVTLVESRRRPAVFLDECVDALGLSSASVQRARAEELAGTIRADIVTARAVASLPRLAEWSFPLLAPGGELLAIKGESAETELAEARSRLHGLGARGPEVVRAGEGTVREPATVVRVPAGGRTRAGPSHRRKRGRSPG